MKSLNVRANSTSNYGSLAIGCAPLNLTSESQYNALSRQTGKTLSSDVWWKDPPIKRDREDYDGIEEVRLKSVSEIPTLIRNRPKRCTMISTEHSSFRTLKCGRRTNFFKVIWEKQ